ncbi:MAG: homoserine O-acetyltransferase [Gammaproteobacteria bacterium]|nr:homoserine O-acetyltransferase [Gammaproteobacteria bacterium]
MTAARRHHRLTGEFPMHRGDVLLEPTIAYETWGSLNAAASNAVLIFTGLSPSAHAASCDADPTPGWWEGIVGPGLAIDTQRYFVICVNSLGSCFGSTGPASIDPRSGRRYGLRFPLLSLEDVARGGFEVLQHLGVQRLHTLVGPSMGGMSALAFELLFPGLSERLLLISTCAHSLPFAVALRSLQREMIRRDPAWRGGEYPADAVPVQGMRLARKLGMLTYRSAEEMQQRFGRRRVPSDRIDDDPFGISFEIESYLEHHANRFTGEFDPNCFLYLSRASDLFDVAEHADGVSNALGRIRARESMVIGVSSDFLFPIAQQKELASGLSGHGREARFVEIASLQGHDSFLVDMPGFQPVIGEFFAA